MIPTIKIKPSHESQGEYVLINVEDFNPELHEKFGEVKKAELPENEFLKRKAELIIEELPALTDEELAALRADEEAGKARQGVLAAIEKELSARAAAKAEKTE